MQVRIEKGLSGGCNLVVCAVLKSSVKKNNALVHEAFLCSGNGPLTATGKTGQVPIC